MTQPPAGWPGGTSDPQPGAVPPPPPPAGWPQYPPPAPSGVEWAPPVPGPHAGGPWEPLPQQGYDVAPAKKTGRGKLIAAAVAVVAVAGGGVATYAAVSSSNKDGAGSPREAIQTIVNDLNKSDLIGVLEDLAPGERAALANPARDSIDQLKRLRVLQPSADPSSVSGVRFQASGLQFAPDTIKVNDHVEIVQLTGGTVTVGSDLSKIPFTGEFLKVAFPDGLPAAGAPQTQDIGKAVADNGGRFRLAAQKVGGRWYPSIAYTIADNAAHAAGVSPTPADYIPAVGAATPEDAARQAVTALLAGDITGAIKLASPEELAALHDYGGIIAKSRGYGSAPVTIKNLEFNTQSISGNARRVTLKKVTVDDGTTETTVVMEGSCASVTTDGKTERLCATDIVTQALSFIDQFGGNTSTVTQAQRDALTRAIAGLVNVGLDVSQTDGKWYVNPVRSYLDLTNALLGSLQGDDVIQLIKLFQGAGH